MLGRLISGDGSEAAVTAGSPQLTNSTPRLPEAELTWEEMCVALLNRDWLPEFSARLPEEEE
jgi:hypothetical protein